MRTVTRPLYAALAALLAAALLVVPGGGAAAATTAGERTRWDTRVFARVPAPGYPAYTFRHRNGRVYQGTYTNPTGDSYRSRVLEYAGDGTLLRSWTVPGQDLDAPRGVQVAAQDAAGRLVLLEKSRAAVLTLDPATGEFRRWATLPDLPTCSPGASPCSPSLLDSAPIPNFATWGPGGDLYVTDYGQAVIWRIDPKRPRRARPWFASPALDGMQFGTTGIAFRPGRRDLLVAQQVGGVGTTSGRLHRLPIRADGRPGRLRTLWTSLPGELPDGFGVAESGDVYVANAGTTAQLVQLGPDGEELDRFPDVPATGENGSPIPFDTPSSATFHGRRVLVANQAYLGNTDHHAILDVYVGEPGRAPYLPRTALWR